jgi:hypothetical protein
MASPAATADARSYGNISFLTKGHAAYHYSRLFKYEAGPGIPTAASGQCPTPPRAPGFPDG